MDQYYPYLQWIDKERKGIASVLEKWANIHSGTGNLQGITEMLENLKEAFQVLGGTHEEIALPTRKVLNIDGAFEEVPLGKAYTVACHPEAPIQILLAGHMDIAYPADKILLPCRYKSRDILVGRGTADMKGGLLIMLTALKALEKSPFAAKVGWKILITPDEEVGSPSSSEILRKFAKNSHIGLIFEPSPSDGSLVSSRKGSLNYTVVVKGVAAHSGRDFSKGRNALSSVARFALAAESLTDLQQGITVNVGHLSGGGTVNIVPDQAMCRINVRVKTSDDAKMIMEKFATIAEIENNRGGITATLFQDSERPPKPFDKKTRALFELLKTCGAGLGLHLKWKPSGGVCDGNILSEAGLTTVDTLGGVGGNLHTAEEYVSISSLLQRAKLVGRFLMQMASGEVTIK